MSCPAGGDRLEIELAKHYIARARERYDEGPWAPDMVNRLPSAA
jgi:hypothetical protein